MVYFAGFAAAGFFGFMGPFGFPFYMLCLFAVAITPAVAIVCLVRVFVERLWLTAVIALIAIPTFFTLLGTGRSTYLASPYAHALQVGEKHVVLYCYPPRNIFDGSPRCWIIMTTPAGLKVVDTFVMPRL